MDAIIQSFPQRTASSERASARPSRAEAEAAVDVLLRWIGEDPTREGLRETPARVIRSFEEFFSGYGSSADATLERVFTNEEDYRGIVLVRDIPFSSHCEHHMLPFMGVAHIAYYPSEAGIIGLSKLGRLVDVFAKRLQTQERLTQQIANVLEKGLHPHGCAVMLQAEHLCMRLRGVRKPGAQTVTTAFKGVFETEVHEQLQFLTLIASKNAG